MTLGPRPRTVNGQTVVYWKEAERREKGARDEQAYFTLSFPPVSSFITLSPLLLLGYLLLQLFFYASCTHLSPPWFLYGNSLSLELRACTHAHTDHNVKRTANSVIPLTDILFRGPARCFLGLAPARNLGNENETQRNDSRRKHRTWLNGELYDWPLYCRHTIKSLTSSETTVLDIFYGREQVLQTIIHEEETNRSGWNERYRTVTLCRTCI